MGAGVAGEDPCELQIEPLLAPFSQRRHFCVVGSLLDSLSTEDFFFTGSMK